MALLSRRGLDILPQGLSRLPHLDLDPNEESESAVQRYITARVVELPSLRSIRNRDWNDLPAHSYG